MGHPISAAGAFVSSAQQYEPTEAEIDAVLKEFQGDARQAIAGLLRGITAIAAEQGRLVSYGYLRGHFPTLDTLLLP